MRCFLVFFLLTLTCILSDAKTEDFTQKEIVLAASAWDPLMGRNLEGGGYLPEVIKAALSKAGYSLRVEWVSWDRAIELSKRGHFDGVIAAGNTIESLRYFNISDSVMSEDYGYFALKDFQISQISPRQMRLPIVGAIKTSSIMEELKHNEKIVIKEEYHQFQNIKNLLDGKIDAFVGGRRHVENILATRFPGYQDQVTMAEHIKTYEHHYIMISQKHPNSKKIINDFDRAFRSIQESGQDNEIRLKYGLSESFSPINASVD